jgi:carboxypeptidase C (cathepsin A)
MGALGPRWVEFADNGTVLPTPARLTDNPQSWLAFTDLVFVDPVGTGYSREPKDDADKDDRKKTKATTDPLTERHAWGVAEDTGSLARFIRTYLTNEQRRLAPVCLAGESYGGFRVARLSRLLQSDFGIAPSGLVLISPALDFSLLWGG